jgi:hypothetical protein
LQTRRAVAYQDDPMRCLFVARICVHVSVISFSAAKAGSSALHLFMLILRPAM